MKRKKKKESDNDMNPVFIIMIAVFIFCSILGVCFYSQIAETSAGTLSSLRETENRYRKLRDSIDAIPEIIARTIVVGLPHKHRYHDGKAIYYPTN